jgi:hypothetical protein
VAFRSCRRLGTRDMTSSRHRLEQYRRLLNQRRWWTSPMWRLQSGFEHFMTLLSGDLCYSTNTLLPRSTACRSKSSASENHGCSPSRGSAAHGAALIRAGETIIDENEPCSAVPDRKSQVGAHNHAPSIVRSPVASDFAFEITAAGFQGLRLCLMLR